jgi:hypothetical protein
VEHPGGDRSHRDGLLAVLDGETTLTSRIAKDLLAASLQRVDQICDRFRTGRRPCCG